MGSSFSILNDTKHNVWITHGINWEFLTVFVQGASISLTAGMTIAGVSAGEEGALAGEGSSSMTEEGRLV